MTSPDPNQSPPAPLSQRPNNPQKKDRAGAPIPASWLQQQYALERRQLRARLVIAGLLIALSAVMVFFVPPRAVDPGYRFFVLEPIVGLVLFWPLSRVLIPSTSLFWGIALSLLPAVILITVRVFGQQRDIASGSLTNLSYGTMVFLGVCSMAAYILFGRSRS